MATCVHSHQVVCMHLANCIVLLFWGKPHLLSTCWCSVLHGEHPGSVPVVKGTGAHM